MIRLPLKLEEIRKMIARLPEVEETPWGKELKERWTAEARAEAAEARAKAAEARERAAKAAEARADDLRQMIQRREEDLRHYEELFRSGAIQDAAFGDLTQRAQRELERFRSELDETALAQAPHH